MNNKLLSVRDLSSFLHVHPKTIYKWKNECRIPYSLINDQIRFSENDIQNWIDERKHSPAYPPSFHIKSDISLVEFDKMLLKGRSALSKKNSKRWNYGFGAVYTRQTKGGKNRWYIDFRNEEGRRVQKVVKTAQTREEAVLALQTHVAKCFSSDYKTSTRPEKIRFSKFADMFIDNYSKVNKDSWKDDKCRLDKFKSFFKTKYLHEIKPIDIERFKQLKMNDDLTNTTINHYLKILRRLFNIAISWGYASENPVKHVKMLSEKDSRRERILSGEEEERLFQHAAEHLKSIMRVALNTGLRKGDILQLKWAQIDLKERKIKVSESKTKKYHTIDINSDLYIELIKLKAQSNGQEHVFINPKTGKPYTKIQKSFNGACQRAEIEDLHFHDLRHSFGSRLMADGELIYNVKELLGHSSIKTTERYLHADKKDLKNAVERLCKKPPETAQNKENLLHIRDTKEKSKKAIPVFPFFSVN